MANVNKTSYAVSVTPKIKMGESNGVNVEMEVINENVRKSLGGGAEIIGNDTSIGGGWNDGTPTLVSSNEGTVPTHDANTDLIFIKNTGYLVGTTTKAAAADTVLVKHNSDVIATLDVGAAIVLPKPTDAVLTLGSGSAHVDVEILVVGT